MKIKCPHCGQHLEIPEQYAGQSGRCKHCNQTFTAPPKPPKHPQPGPMTTKSKRFVIYVMPVIALFIILGHFAGDPPEPSARANETIEAEISAKETTKHQSPVSVEPVDLTLNTRVDGNAIVLSGSANLPDGAVISYEIEHLEDFQFLHDGIATIEDGRYHERFNISGWPRGPIEVWASFAPWHAAQQPAAVTERYGETGENIADKDAVKAGGMLRVEAVSTVTNQAGRPAPRSALTRRDFHRLQQGMTYSQVVDVLGRDGQVMFETGVGAGYQWVNPDGYSNITLYFHQDRLDSKVQFGLE